MTVLDEVYAERFPGWEKCIKRPHSVWTACTCTPCLVNNRRMAKTVRVGRYQRIPPEMGWEVLDRLIAADWTPKAIASATGTGWHRWHSVLRSYATTGYRRRLSPHSCLVLLQLGDPTDGQVGAYAAVRRLRALARIGWGLDDLADRTGIGFSTLAAIRLRDESGRVGVPFYRKILAAYEELHMTPGPSEQALRHATEMGWPPPLAWDDIDDPNEHPKGVGASKGRDPNDVDPVIVDRLLHLERVLSTRAEKEEATRRWLATGGSEKAFCEAHGWKPGRYLAHVQEAS